MYLKRIAETSDIVNLQETHGRFEHLSIVDIVLDWITGGKMGTFTPENVKSGGFVILIRKDIVGPGTSIEHEDFFPGRDYLVRLQQLDCNCTVMNLHDQPDDTLQRLPAGRRTLMGSVPRGRHQHLRSGRG